MFNKKKIKEKQETYKNMTPEEKIDELKDTIRITYRIFYWMSIFLLAPTITYWIIDWIPLRIARDLGIVISTIILWKINKNMKKKMKEEKEGEEDRDWETY